MRLRVTVQHSSRSMFGSWEGERSSRPVAAANASQSLQERKGRLQESVKRTPKVTFTERGGTTCLIKLHAKLKKSTVYGTKV